MTNPIVLIIELLIKLPPLIPPVVFVIAYISVLWRRGKR